MGKKIDEYLLKKYSIPPVGDDSQPGSTLCHILHRLNKNKKLNDIDKKWIQAKGMLRFYKFLKNWEETGEPDFYNLHESYLFPHKSYMSPRKIHPTIQNIPSKTYIIAPHEEIIKDNNNSNKKNKQTKDSNLGTNIRKPHMALHYKQKILKNHIESNIVGIVPSNIPEDISSLFLEKIWNTMNKDIQKDVKELFKVYSIQQWTATSLMAYRLLENVLSIHVEYNLKEESIKSIGDTIKILKDHKYDPGLLNELRKHQEKRNDFMHGNIRAGAGEVKKLVSDIMSIALNIHNIKP
ncbi:MAG: hypothetical protein KAH72_05140 [Flavobacteriaceae bacterium]|nr:hypothetical protein [Flavobacteriaceae bacterium]